MLINITCIKSGADCLSEVLSCGVSLKSKLLAGLPAVVLNSFWFNCLHNLF